MPNFLKNKGVTEADWVELLAPIRGLKWRTDNPIFALVVFFAFTLLCGAALLGALVRRIGSLCTEAEHKFNEKYVEKIGLQVYVDWNENQLVFMPPVATPAALAKWGMCKPEDKTWQQEVMETGMGIMDRVRLAVGLTDAEVDLMFFQPGPHKYLK